MLRKLSLVTVVIMLTIIVNRGIFANAIIPVPTQPQQSILTPSAPSLNAKGYILMDANSGKVLAEKNADEHMAPASLTKLMSLYLVSNALKNGMVHLDDKVRISTKAWQTGGSRMFVKVGDNVAVKDLMQGIIVASGNDATVAMAEYIAGTEETFTKMMNTEAQRLGMRNSHFVDSTGLPNPEQYSSPRDLAILARAITQEYPEDYRLFSEKWFTYNGIRQPNRNRLLWRYPYADGLKTGHTQDAGFCLVASGMKDGTRLISVIMGAPSDEVRTEDSIRVLTYGFRFFETHHLYKATTPLTQARVWKGEKKEVRLGLMNDLYVTLPAGQAKNIQTNIQLNEPLEAPIIQGQTYGTLNIMLNTQVLASQPLIALASDARGSMWRRVSDSFSFHYNKIFSPSKERVNNG